MYSRIPYITEIFNIKNLPVYVPILNLHVYQYCSKMTPLQLYEHQPSFKAHSENLLQHSITNFQGILIFHAI